MSKMKVITFFIQLLMVLSTILIPVQSQAQATMTSTGSVRRNIATIIFCGVGGAVLGISTLSFYGDPQNHIGNITSGFAIGLIGGTVYVTTQATESSLGFNALDPIKELAEKNRNPRPSLAWSWEF